MHADPQHRELTITIALPGEAGTKVDWLDVLIAAGPEAVRAGITAAKAPTQDEIDAAETGPAIRVYGGSLPRNVAEAEHLLGEATAAILPAASTSAAASWCASLVCR